MRDLLTLANDQVAKPKNIDELTPFELSELDNQPIIYDLEDLEDLQ